MASSAEQEPTGHAVASSAAADGVATLVRSLPLRDRLVILSGLGVITVLAWVYLVDMARGMEGMAHDGQVMHAIWSADYFVAMLLMWIIMMVGMMVPSAIPMVLIYAALARKSAREGTVLAPAGLFVAGYVVIWTLFSVAATLAQWALDRASLLSPMMMSNSPIMGGVLLLGAGLYQLTPMKTTCLRHCRSPAHFLAHAWRPGNLGALRMGLSHGAYCLGCCWILMCLLFFGGVMSIWWIGGLTLFVLLEKVMPLGVAGGRLLGGLAAAWGLALLIPAVFR